MAASSILNLLFGVAAAAILISRSTSASSAAARARHQGALLLTSGLTPCCSPRAARAAPASARALRARGGGGVLLVTFFFVERRAAEPILPLLALFGASPIMLNASISGATMGGADVRDHHLYPALRAGRAQPDPTAAGTAFTLAMFSWGGRLAMHVGAALSLKVGFRPLIRVGCSASPRPRASGSCVLRQRTMAPRPAGKITGLFGVGMA